MRRGHVGCEHRKQTDTPAFCCVYVDLAVGSMFFKSGQYPALLGKSKPEQRKLVAAAIRAQDKYANVRFVVIIIVLLSSVPFVSSLVARIGINGAWGILWPVACGLLFYGYMLWELNGPVLKAVERYLASAQPTDQADGPAPGGPTA